MAMEIDYINVDPTDNGGVVVRWTETDRASKQPSWKEHTVAYENLDTGLEKVAELFRNKLTKKSK